LAESMGAVAPAELELESVAAPVAVVELEP